MSTPALATRPAMPISVPSPPRTTTSSQCFGRSSRLHVGRSSHLVHVAMSSLEKSLDPETFLRIHRSILVNVGRIKELEPALHGEYVVTLDNDVRLRSGRTYHEKLKALADNPF